MLLYSLGIYCFLYSWGNHLPDVELGASGLGSGEIPPFWLLGGGVPVISCLGQQIVL